MDLREAARRYLDVRSESGDELDVLCPVHDDTNPSCRVNTKKGVWYCHTCHAKGRLEPLLKELAGGYLHISDEVDLESLTFDVRELTGETEGPHYHPERWLDQFDHDTGYWSERGMSAKTIRRYRLGYNHENHAATYPLRDTSGRVLGVVQRRLYQWAKPRYVYPEGAPVHHNLFGFHELRTERGLCPTVFVAEGAIDALALVEVGVAAVAQYGSRLHEAQVELLRRLGTTTVVLAYDDDEAGDRAAWGGFDKNGERILGAVDLLGGFVVEAIDWSLVRGPERPRRKSLQPDPASVSRRQRRELVDYPLDLMQSGARRA